MMKNKNKDMPADLNTRKPRAKVSPMVKVVKSAMAARKVTTYGLAKVANLKYQTVVNFLKGTHAMRSDKLQAMFDVLGLEVKLKD